MTIKQLVLAVLVLGLAAAGRASATCSSATLTGNYGYVLTGVNNTATLTATVGQMTANGAGTLSGTETISDNGVISADLTTAGTYKISSNCTGTATITPSGGVAANYALVIDSAQKQVEMVETDSGFTVSGYALAQGSANCTLAGVKGFYGYHEFGWQTSPSLTPVAIDGLASADGLGNLTGMQTTSAGGVIFSARVSGTYIVNSNCTGTVTTTVAGKTSHDNVVLVNSGHTALQIVTDAGTISTNVSQKQ